MIVYASTKSGFLGDVEGNRIEEVILAGMRKRLRHSVSSSEIRSYRNSLQHMHTLLARSEVPDDAGVAIEYNIPQTSKRVDFILTGFDVTRAPSAVIIELKQWEDVWPTRMDGLVTTILGGGRVLTNHPSFQAWSYAALLEDFNETVRTEGIRLVPCAYLHNCRAPEVIQDPFYREHTEKAPAFLKTDTAKLRAFIEKYVRKGDRGELIYRIDGGKIKPSKSLADALVGMWRGNREFVLIDDQKLVYETALSMVDRATNGGKQVLVVEGGPGTGKSIVAINLLVELIRREKTVHYVTRNAAPRDVYKSKLSGSLKKSRIDNLFKSSGSYVDSMPDSVDALVVDEAHRLNQKSGMFRNLGEHQIKEIIRAARFSVFFIDENQRVTWGDVGRKEEILAWAGKAGAEVVELELRSQFRCNGSDGYLAWLDHSLQIHDTANPHLAGIDYDFRVFDDPNEVRRLIEEKNRTNNKARMVAGYCWDWLSRSGGQDVCDVDLTDHGFRMRWNLREDGNFWILKPDSVKEIGCIHTCQGLELDYIGVIIGPDLIVRNGIIETHAECRSKMDSSVKGYKSALHADRPAAERKAAEIIKNTYRTLMTRGQKGCFVFCTDPETRAYFREAASAIAAETEKVAAPAPRLPFERLDRDQVIPFQNAVPVLDLEVAAGGFSREQWLSQTDWARLPDPMTAKPGYFVARVVGQSMTRRVPDGAWCLFRSDPGGTREGKVVLVRYFNPQDPETGRFTLKIYQSEKTLDGESWRHARIILKPDSLNPSYRPLVLRPGEADSLEIMGELVAVLG